VNLELSLVGLGVQTVGTVLLAAILVYLSRGKGSPVLQAAGVAWLFLLAALASLLLLTLAGLDYRLEVYQYWKLLYVVAL
jgi:Na+-transporting methylmalonyl-CoA/oxaloacetate decarboxylase beta subunit